MDTDVITSIELSKELLSQAQSADDTLLSAKLHNLLGKANKKNNNINESLHHYSQSSVYYSKLNDANNQIKASINYIKILLDEKRYDELATSIETLLPTTLVYGDEFFVAQLPNSGSFHAVVEFKIKGKIISAMFMHTGVGEHQASTTYSCPMHPEVTSDSPGKCNKCGMNLTEDSHGGNDGHNHSH